MKIYAFLLSILTSCAMYAAVYVDAKIILNDQELGACAQVFELNKPVAISSSTAFKLELSLVEQTDMQVKFLFKIGDAQKVITPMIIMALDNKKASAWMICHDKTKYVLDIQVTVVD